MHMGSQQGYLSIGIILMGAVVGLTTIAQLNQKSEHSIVAAKVRQDSLEGEESALYAFTVLKQLFDNASGQSALGLTNNFDPAALTDINVQSLQTLPINRMMMINSRSMSVQVPDLLGQSTAQMTSLFENADFRALDRKSKTVRLDIIDFESYSSGFGVKTLIVESVQKSVLSNQREHRQRARIPLPMPLASCEIRVDNEVIQGGTLTKTQITPDQSLRINARCQGTLIAAHLEVNQIRVKEAIKPTLLDPVFSDYSLSQAGRYELRARAILVDESVVSSLPVVLNIEAPFVADRMAYKKCLYKCACGYPQFAEPTLCQGTTDFVNPFHELHTLDALPAISGNPLQDPAAMNVLERWAFARGAKNEAETHGTKLQGLLYPANGYGTKLACSKVGGGGNWLTWAFDPNNNCKEEFIGSRGAIGCLVEGSRVMIGPGRLKPIETLTPNDQIWNPHLGRYFTIKKLIHGMESKPLHTIQISGKSLTMTNDHPVLTDRGYLQAKDIKLDDRLLLEGQFVKVDQIRTVNPSQATRVWNVIVDEATTWEEHLMFVEGVAVGDLWMQEALSQSANDSINSRP